MTFLVAGSFVILILFLLFSSISPAILFTFLAGSYYFLGLIKFEELMKGYMSESLCVIVLLVIISSVIQRTFLNHICEKLIFTGGQYKRDLFKLGIFTSFFSAFLNNTAVVANLMRPVYQNKFYAPSKFLIPLSYFAIVGGTMTLIGTSTNLIANNFVISHNLESFKLFDFFEIGFLVSVCVIFTVICMSFLLPQYPVKKFDQEHLISAKVNSFSELIGKSVKESGLRSLQFLFLTEIIRKDQVIVPVSHHEIIQAEDQLIFSGNIKYLDILKQFHGLEIIDEKYNLQDLKLVDVIVAPTSDLIGLRVRESSFRSKFDSVIIAFKRGFLNISKIGQEVFRSGDRLILAIGNNFWDKYSEKDFYFISNVLFEKSFNKLKSFLILFIFFLTILGSVFGLFSFLKGLLVFFVGLILTKSLSLREIKKQFPYELVLIIGSSVGIAQVLETSGVLSHLVNFIFDQLSFLSVYGALIGIFFLSLIFTEMMSNNSAVILILPIAYALSIKFNTDPIPFILACTYGASASFIFPHSYQTNLMVNSLGGYSIRDFIRIGWIVSLVYSLVVISAIIFLKF